MKPQAHHSRIPQRAEMGEDLLTICIILIPHNFLGSLIVFLILNCTYKSSQMFNRSRWFAEFIPEKTVDMIELHAVQAEVLCMIMTCALIIRRRLLFRYCAPVPYVLQDIAIQSKVTLTSQMKTEYHQSPKVVCMTELWFDRRKDLQEFASSWHRNYDLL